MVLPVANRIVDVLEVLILVKLSRSDQSHRRTC